MLILTLIALISLISALIVYLWHVQTSPRHQKTRAREQRPRGGARAQGLGQRRRHTGAAVARRQNAEDVDGEDNPAQAANGAGPSRRSAKKRAKEARRQAAQARNLNSQATEPIYEDSDEGSLEEEDAAAKSAYELAREKKDEERSAQEIAEEEEIRLAYEARKKQEEADFEAWKDFISMEDAGEAAESVDQVQQRREAMCEFMKAHKVVELSTLSQEFGIRTNEVISEVEELEKLGMLTGVMDDRGKYLYFSMDDLKKLAHIIQTRGRISIADVAREASAMLQVPEDPDVDVAADEATLQAMLEV